MITPEVRIKTVIRRAGRCIMDSHSLLEACAEGNLAEVEALLKRGADASFQDDDGKSALMAAAASGRAEVVRRLLEAGAAWNALDKSGKCAGDYAVLGGHDDAAQALLDAGVRAELVFAAIDRGASSMRAPTVSNSEYLDQKLRFSGDGERILDADGEAVMMAWERPLMEAHAEAICSAKGDVLNVGFGLGLVDECIQRRRPRSHTIIEAHPDVYERMKQLGWDKKEGVRIVFGRWQDVLEDLGQFDGVFFDTFGEYYPDMREFHNRLPKLLRPGGIYSFFNGLAPDNAFFHAVYCQIVELEMAQLGFETTFVPLAIDASDDAIWKGVKNRYWWSDTYYLPVCQLEEKADT